VTNQPVRPAADSVRSQSGEGTFSEAERCSGGASVTRSPCPECEGTGVLHWQQPVPTADGSLKLVQAEEPCPDCAPRKQRADDPRVVDAPTELPARQDGWAKKAGKITGAAPAWLDDIEQMRQEMRDRQKRGK